VLFAQVNAIELLAGLASDETKILPARVSLKILQSLPARSSRRMKLQSAEIQPRFEFKLLVTISDRLVENGLQRLRCCGLLAGARIHFSTSERRHKVGRAIACAFGQSEGIDCSGLGAWNFGLRQQNSRQQGGGLAGIGRHCLLFKLRGRRAN